MQLPGKNAGKARRSPRRESVDEEIPEAGVPWISIYDSEPG